MDIKKEWIRQCFFYYKNEKNTATTLKVVQHKIRRNQKKKHPQSAKIKYNKKKSF